MAETPTDIRTLGARHIAAVDAQMAAVMEIIGPCTLSQGRGRYAALIGAIVGQQVSTASARAVRERLRQAAGGYVTPARIAQLDHDALRGVGLSR